MERFVLDDRTIDHRHIDNWFLRLGCSFMDYAALVLQENDGL